MLLQDVLKKAIKRPINSREALFLFEQTEQIHRALDLLWTASSVRDRETRKTIYFDGFIGPVIPCRNEPPCKYCIRSAKLPDGTPLLEIYEKTGTLSLEEISLGIKAIKDTGIGTLLLLGGTNPQFIPVIKQAVKITREVAPDLKIRINVGPAFENNDLLELKNSGVTGITSSFEIMNKRLFRKFKPADSLEKRIKLARMIDKLDFELQSGMLIGLGESYRDRVEHMFYLKNFKNFNYFIVNWLHPFKGTPVEDYPSPSPFEAARTAAIARLIFRDIYIQVAIRPYIQLWLMAGCNRFADMVYLWAYRKENWPGRSVLSNYLGELIAEVEVKGMKVEKIAKNLYLKNLLPIMVGYIKSCGLKLETQILQKYPNAE